MFCAVNGLTFNFKEVCVALCDRCYRRYHPYDALEAVWRTSIDLNYREYIYKLQNNIYIYIYMKYRVRAREEKARKNKKIHLGVN
jgi:hypothetical protein